MGGVRAGALPRFTKARMKATIVMGAVVDNGRSGKATLHRSWAVGWHRRTTLPRLRKTMMEAVMVMVMAWLWTTCGATRRRFAADCRPWVSLALPRFTKTRIEVVTDDRDGRDSGQRVE